MLRVLLAAVYSLICNVHAFAQCEDAGGVEESEGRYNHRYSELANLCQLSLTNIYTCYDGTVEYEGVDYGNFNCTSVVSERFPIYPGLYMHSTGFFLELRETVYGFEAHIDRDKKYYCTVASKSCVNGRAQTELTFLASHTVRRWGSNHIHRVEQTDNLPNIEWPTPSQHDEFIADALPHSMKVVMRLNADPLLECRFSADLDTLNVLDERYSVTIKFNGRRRTANLNSSMDIGSSVQQLFRDLGSPCLPN